MFVDRSATGAGCHWGAGQGLATKVMVALMGLVVGSPAALSAESGILGAYGPEGPRLREQLWILPSGDPQTVLRATVFRPPNTTGSVGGAVPEDSDAEGTATSAKWPLAVINHGTTDETRAAVSMPVYYWLSRWFVERGFVVVLPQRRGHGATGGPLAESIGSCAAPDHYTSGLIASDDISAAIGYMSQQTFIDPQRTIVVGVSTGGWASLALASRKPSLARAIINFAGGRGGHAHGRANAVCGASQLVEAARAYGSTSAIPTLWLYAENDSYFSPDLARAMTDAWRDGGGHVELELLPPYLLDGHDIADDRVGWEFWGHSVERFLNANVGVPAPVRTPDQPTLAAEQPAQVTMVPASSDAGAPELVPPREH